jgi:hypothetical protein
MPELANTCGDRRCITPADGIDHAVLERAPHLDAEAEPDSGRHDVRPAADL